MEEGNGNESNKQKKGSDEMSTEISCQKYLNEFRKAFTLGIESIVQASEIYVKAIEENPKNADVFREEFSDSIPASAWSNFEAVGRKWMHPRLLLGGGGRYSGNIKRLPYSTQERIFNGEKFDLLTTDGDKLKVDVRSVTPEQIEQLVDKTSIRTIAEQKSFLEARKKAVKENDENDVVMMPYVVRGGKVYFKANAILTKDEVKRLAMEMM